jgi:hypothetical protein
MALQIQGLRTIRQIDKLHRPRARGYVIINSLPEPRVFLKRVREEKKRNAAPYARGLCAICGKRTQRAYT